MEKNNIKSQNLYVSEEEKILNFLKNDEDISWELSIFEEIGSTNDYLLENSKKNKISILIKILIIFIF